MADKNPPLSNNKKNGGQKQQKRKINPGDKFDWRKATRTLTFWILLVIGSWIVFRQINLNEQSETKKSYSQYLKLLDSGQISSAEIVEREFHGVLDDGSSIITVLPFIDSDMLAQWDSLRIDYQFREKTTSWFGYLITSILPWVIIIAIWLYIMRRMQGGGQRGLFSFGKSRAKLQMENAPKVTFKDVAGVDEAKEELKEIIAFLRDPKKFSRLGGRLPKGGLLLGPPGTGKTLLARAVAGEADVPFFSMSGADFVEMFVGVGAARVRDLFEQGKKNAPCIIFIDEIDAVGRHRGAGLGGGHDEREQTLNQLLVEMDGFESNEGVILIAATNRPDVLDPALTRPGRFDRQIVVDRPDVRGREGILNVHSRNIPLARDVKMNILAKGTPGLAGADIANMVNEAALLAARRGAKKVTMADFEEAKDKIMMGTERKSILISEEEKRQTAYHEAGHVLVSKLTPGADPVHKVTIIPRGRALGLTHYLPLDEKHNYSRSYLTQSLNHLLGGRAAEKLVFNELSTGAGNDIERATQIARKMVCEWGMSDKLGPVTYGRKQEEIFLGRDFVQQRDFSERTAQDIDQEVRSIVTEAEKRAEDILRNNKDKLKVLAEALLDREILDGAEIDRLIKGEKLPPVHTRAQERRTRHRPSKGRKPQRHEPVRADQDRKEPIRKDKEPIRKDKEPIRRDKEPIRRNKEPIRRDKEPIRRDKEPARKDKDDAQPSSPRKSRRQFARSYGIASSRDRENQRPRPAERIKITRSVDEPQGQDDPRTKSEKPQPKRDTNQPADSAKKTESRIPRFQSYSRTRPSKGSDDRGKEEARRKSFTTETSTNADSPAAKSDDKPGYKSFGIKRDSAKSMETETSVTGEEKTDKQPSFTHRKPEQKSLANDAVKTPEIPRDKTVDEITERFKDAAGGSKSTERNTLLPRYDGAGFDALWNRGRKSDSPPDVPHSSAPSDDTDREKTAPSDDKRLDSHPGSGSDLKKNEKPTTGSDAD